MSVSSSGRGEYVFQAIHFICLVFFFNLDRDARTLLAKNLPYKVTQDELKEVFEDAVEIRLVSKDGKSKGYVLCVRNVDFH